MHAIASKLIAVNHTQLLPLGCRPHDHTNNTQPESHPKAQFDDSSHRYQNPLDQSGSSCSLSPTSHARAAQRSVRACFVCGNSQPVAHVYVQWQSVAHFAL